MTLTLSCGLSIIAAIVLRNENKLDTRLYARYLAAESVEGVGLRSVSHSKACAGADAGELMPSQRGEGGESRVMSHASRAHAPMRTCVASRMTEKSAELGKRCFVEN